MMKCDSTIACDGIWNFMSSQEVVDYVNERINNTPDDKLSSICEEVSILFQPVLRIRDVLSLIPDPDHFIFHLGSRILLERWNANLLFAIRYKVLVLVKKIRDPRSGKYSSRILSRIQGVRSTGSWIRNTGFNLCFRFVFES
jgi:hypothetical protein